MIETVPNQLLEIKNTYDRLLSYADEIFLLLKHKDFETLKKLNRQQLQTNDELREQLQNLQKLISTICLGLGLPQDEVKLSNILVQYGMKEREDIVALQNATFHAEKKLKTAIRNNQILAEAMMTCSQSVVDTWAYVASQESQTNRNFVNRKV
jgi:predicted component of type VI protein secretion system